MYIPDSNKKSHKPESDPFAVKRYDVEAVTMEVNGLKAILNMPKARDKIKDAGGKEIAQYLPEYNQRPAFMVDKYPACPDNWMHGNGNSSSYFVPILPEHGMWLDFTPNSYFMKGGVPYDVAVIPSIQGINPLTGMKSDPIRLEQYRQMCPKHQREFKQDRFCDDCKYNWHPQNYLCSNNGSMFWIDGFRTEDGTIRQWYFTEDECKGIAAQVIGKERVFAIGLAFYISKKPKSQPQIVHHWMPFVTEKYIYGNPFLGSPASYGSLGTGSGEITYNSGGHTTWSCTSSSIAGSTSGYEPLGDIYNNQRLGSFEAESQPVEKKPKKSTKIKTGRRKRRSRGPSGQSRKLGSRLSDDTRGLDTAFIGAMQSEIASTQKMLEIGAGAMIRQMIEPDPQELDYWQEEPEGFIYVNYCDVATAQKIIAAGTREELGEGFLSGLNIK